MKAWIKVAMEAGVFGLIVSVVVFMLLSEGGLLFRA